MDNTSLYYILQYYSNNKISASANEQFPDCPELMNSLSLKCTIQESYLSGIDFFWTKFFNSTCRIIIDPCFPESGTHFILDTIKNMNAESPLDTEECVTVLIVEKEYKKIRNYVNNQISINNNMYKYNKIKVFHMNTSNNANFYCHDRFVWLNGNIWHFGSTVGGLYNSFKLTACSGPWKDNNLKMYRTLSSLFGFDAELNNDI